MGISLYNNLIPENRLNTPAPVTYRMNETAVTL